MAKCRAVNNYYIKYTLLHKDKNLYTGGHIEEEKMWFGENVRTGSNNTDTIQRFYVSEQGIQYMLVILHSSFPPYPGV